MQPFLQELIQIRALFKQGENKFIGKKASHFFRTRKTDHSLLVGSSLELSSSHYKEHLVTIESLRQRYIKDSGVHISAKCFHNRLDQEGHAAFGLDLISSALKSHVRLCNHMQCGMYTVLMKELGVDDIILVDGTEIAVRESLVADIGHSGSRLRASSGITRALPQCTVHYGRRLLRP
mgnify:CR=1 FL=1